MTAPNADPIASGDSFLGAGPSILVGVRPAPKSFTDEITDAHGAPMPPKSPPNPSNPWGFGGASLSDLLIQMSRNHAGFLRSQNKKGRTYESLGF